MIALLALQADSGSSGGPFGGIDWGQLVPNVVGLFLTSFLAWLDKALRAVFDGLWNSGANLIGHTDPAWTTHFGPAADVLGDARGAVYGIFLLATVLMALRALITAITGASILGSVFDSLLLVSFKLAAFFAVLDTMVDAVNAASQAAGTAPVNNLPGMLPSDPVLLLLMLGVAIYFTIRLFIRGGYRVVWLAILTVLAPVGIALEALPFETCKRWSGLWAQEWFGWLWAIVPSVACLNIGWQLAGRAGNAGIFLIIGFLQLSYDMYGYFTSGRAGGGLLGGAISGGLRLATAATGGGAAVAAQGAYTSVSAATGSAVAEQYGY